MADAQRHWIALVALIGALGAPAHADDGRARLSYMLHCQGCHLADGSGSPEAVPDLRKLSGRLASFQAGREYLVRVPGVAQADLGDARLAELLNWMLRELSGTDPGIKPFSATEVARYRAAPLTDVEAERQRLVEQLETRGGTDP